jgi:UDP-N-acetyl-D-glucosamine dehydrogenase
MGFIENAARILAGFLRPEATVILESMTYPGTTEELVLPILEDGSGLTAGDDFSPGLEPGTHRPGQQDWTLVNTPKIVRASIPRRWTRFVSSTRPSSIGSSSSRAPRKRSWQSCFRYVNVALVNELAMFAANMGIDMHEAIEAASSNRLGSCSTRPVRASALSANRSELPVLVGQAHPRSQFPLRGAANDVNDHMPEYVIRRLTAALNSFRKPINGAAASSCSDWRTKPTRATCGGSPALAVAERLVQLGAEVRAVEPHVKEVREARVPLVDLTPEEVADTDAVVFLTDHDEFDLELVRSEAQYVFDTRS